MDDANFDALKPDNGNIPLDCLRSFFLANVGLWGGLRIESAFFDFHLQAPLCGVKRVRVEVQNVGNILLR